MADTQTTYDIAIIGGGITGAGLLRDCAMRGLKSILVEKGEPGNATTASSTHLIHGGLRYLLYDRITTHTTCWDSGNIVRIARPLLTRLPILWPIYRGHQHGSETVETLLESYDSLARMKEGMPHLRLSAMQTLRILPSLKKEGLLGSVSFDEWWVDPVRLVAANLESAQRFGAEFQAQMRAVGFLRQGPSTTMTSGIPSHDASRDRIQGIKIENAQGSGELRAKLVINASGPWVDQIARLADLHVPLRLQKGTHLVYDQAPDSLRSGLAHNAPIGLILEATDRGRYVFIIATPSQTLVGPTDLAGPDDPDKTASDPAEIRYLLDSARRYFAGFPERFDRTIVGARPILGQKGSEKLLSREYEVLDHETRDGVPGLITVAGGKMSDFRLMAQDGADLACWKLNKDAPCRTHEWTLSGKILPPRPTFPKPSRFLKRFLRKHPHLREFYALAYLGGAFARHLGRRMTGKIHESSLEKFAAHYFTG